MNEAQEFVQNITSDPNFARLEKDIEAVKNDISNLSQQISDAVGALTQIAQTQARHGARRARVRANALMSDASDRAGVVAGAAQDAASSVGDSIADAIEERPLATVAIAMGIGFLIGVTWRR
jgi:ElaB/YqjD/DUF883 family membrane-anchored ribosome-binding protein